MLVVLGAATVSAMAILLGLALIASEFRNRWPQVLAALANDVARPVIVPMPLRAHHPVVARRPVRAVYRPQSLHRLAA